METEELWHVDTDTELEALGVPDVHPDTVPETVANAVLLVVAVTSAVGDPPGLEETDGELDSVDVWQSEVEGELEALKEPVTLKVPVVEKEPPPVLLCDTVAQWEEETLGLVDTEREFDSVEVWHPDTDGDTVAAKDAEAHPETEAEASSLGEALVDMVPLGVNAPLGLVEGVPVIEWEDEVQPEEEWEGVSLWDSVAEGEGVGEFVLWVVVDTLGEVECVQLSLALLQALGVAMGVSVRLPLEDTGGVREGEGLGDCDPLPLPPLEVCVGGTLVVPETE